MLSIGVLVEVGKVAVDDIGFGAAELADRQSPAPSFVSGQAICAAGGRRGSVRVSVS